MEFTPEKVNNMVEMMNSTEEDQNVALEVLNNCDIENNIVPILIILKLQHTIALYNIEDKAPELYNFITSADYVINNIISFNTIYNIMNKFGDLVSQAHKDMFNACVSDFLCKMAHNAGMSFVDGISTQIKEVVNDKDRITS